MKRFVSVALIIVFLMNCAFLSSCGPEEKTPEQIDWSLYTIVTPVGGAGLQSNPGGALGNGKNRITELRDALEENCGKKLPFASELDEPSEYEIIIGDTCRPETAAAQNGLRFDDYVIAYDGKKITVAAYPGNSTNLTAAVGRLIQLIPTVTSETPSGDLYRKTGSYAADGILLNGTDIRDYTIVYQSEYYLSSYTRIMTENEILGDFNSGKTSGLKGAVNYFESYIVRYCGIRPNKIGLSKYKTDPEQYSHVIFFGSGCGGISDGLSAEGSDGYVIVSDGSNIALTVSDPTAIRMGRLAVIFATEFFGNAPVSDGVMRVEIPEGRVTGRLD